jgi:hypothetical protein
MTTRPTNEGDEALVLGGFIVVRPVLRTEHLDPALLPPKVLTASECVGVIAPSTWSIAWASCTDDERRRRLARFGLPESDLAEIVSWTTSHFDQGFGSPNVFTSLDCARSFVDRFAASVSHVRLVALCLAECDVDAFLNRARDQRSAPSAWEI